MRAHPAGAMHGEGAEPPHLLGPPPKDPSRLDPSIWPIGAERTAGVLQLGGCDVRDLVTTHGSPAYIVVEDDVRARCRGYRAAFGGDADIYYAAKAFLSKAVAQWILEEDLSLDVATEGELATALAAGFPPERILVHGNNKSLGELKGGARRRRRAHRHRQRRRDRSARARG